MTPSEDSRGLSADVIVVGGGAAGATAAAVMARRNVRVILVDQRAVCPPCFKAEKIEPHQADLFRKFGLMDYLTPLTGRVRKILDARDGRIFKEIPIEQYGIFYHDLVNAIRSSTEAVQLKVGRVVSLALSPTIQTVTMADNTVLTARLIVDACGTSTSLVNGIGLQRDTIEREQSIAFGFTIAPTDGASFPFDSVTYYPQIGATGVGYLTLFRIGQATRANLFVFWPPRDERTRRLQQSMQTEVVRLFPKLTDVIGEFKLVSKVETGLIDLYRTLAPARDGLVLIGDAFQSVCPTTATGLSKILSDVDALCYDCLPEWLATPGMGAGKIQAFYDHPGKQDVDSRSLGGGMYQRAMAINTSLGWTARRWRRALRLRQAEWQYNRQAANGGAK